MFSLTWIRNRRKIEAIVGNAQQMLELDKTYKGFRNYLRSHAGFDELVKDLRKHFKFLGDMPAEETSYRIPNLGACHKVSVFDGQLPHVAERHTPRHYENLVYWVSIRQYFNDKGVSCLVVGSNFLFLRAYLPTLSLWTSDYPVYRLLKLLHLNNFLASP